LVTIEGRQREATHMSSQLNGLEKRAPSKDKSIRQLVAEKLQASDLVASEPPVASNATVSTQPQPLQRAQTNGSKKGGKKQRRALGGKTGAYTEARRALEYDYLAHVCLPLSTIIDNCFDSLPSYFSCSIRHRVLPNPMGMVVQLMVWLPPNLDIQFVQHGVHQWLQVPSLVMYCIVLVNNVDLHYLLSLVVHMLLMDIIIPRSDDRTIVIIR
jgi:hypothetical protein